MRILPARIQAPKSPFHRRHDPADATGQEGYQRFRACLRWDFGFTCALCLLHEADLGGGPGVEGLALTGVEHRTPQSADPALRNVYSNCLYACRLCNTARGAKAAQTPSGRLLDPTVDAWAAHFDVVESHLVARDADTDAAYTHVAYDLDDPRKVERRRVREEVVDDARSVLDRGPDLLDRLMRWIDANAGSGSSVQAMRDAEALQANVRAARRTLVRFAAIPQDAPFVCGCGREAARTLPPQMAEGTWEMADLLPSAPAGSPE